MLRLSPVLYFGLALLSSWSTGNLPESNQGRSVVKSEEEHSKAQLSLRFEKGIATIFEDSKGALWFGSKEEGVCRFDGESCKYLTKEDGLQHNQVRTIQEDAKGNIWFRTGGGICYYDGSSIKTVPQKAEWNVYAHPVNPQVESTTEWSLSSGDIWFQVNNNGIIKWTGTHLDYLSFPTPDGYVKANDNDIHMPFLTLKTYKAPSGKVWFGTFSQGAIGFDGKSFEYHNPDSFGIGTTRAIFQDRSGDLWLASNGGGLYRYDGKHYFNFTKEHNLVSDDTMQDRIGTLSRVWSIGQDADRNMWFGTADSGLWKYDGSKLTNYTTEDGLPSNFVETIFLDSKGVLWFCSGMSSNGVLYTFDGKSFQIINAPTGQ